MNLPRTESEAVELAVTPEKLGRMLACQVQKAFDANGEPAGGYDDIPAKDRPLVNGVAAKLYQAGIYDAITVARWWLTSAQITGQDEAAAALEEIVGELQTLISKSSAADTKGDAKATPSGGSMG